MRACAVGLETEVFDLSEEEILGIPDNGLKGELKFWKVGSDEKSRKIPFTIIYSPEQREFVSVRLTPEDIYFGEANSIEFSINHEIYLELAECGISGARFWGAGKLICKKKGLNSYLV